MLELVLFTRYWNTLSFAIFLHFFSFSASTFFAFTIVGLFTFVQVVFAGFSAESLAQRIIDCKPKVVITCNAVKRGSKVINLKDIVDAALGQSAQSGVSIGGKFILINMIS